VKLPWPYRPEYYERVISTRTFHDRLAALGKIRAAADRVRALDPGIDREQDSQRKAYLGELRIERPGNLAAGLE
jgi:hypothetical protein